MISLRDLAQRKYYLPTLILINSIILFLNALFILEGKVLWAMFLVEVITFGLVFNMPGRQTIRLEIFALLATLGQILLSSIVLFGTCQFSEKAVCNPANLELQIKFNALTPLVTLIFLWFAYRVPALIKKVK